MSESGEEAEVVRLHRSAWRRRVGRVFSSPSLLLAHAPPAVPVHEFLRGFGLPLKLP